MRFLFFTIIYRCHYFKFKISKLIFQLFFFLTFHRQPKVLLCISGNGLLTSVRLNNFCIVSVSEKDIEPQSSGHRIHLCSEPQPLCLFTWLDRVESNFHLFKMTHNVGLCAYIVKEWKQTLNNIRINYKIYFTLNIFQKIPPTVKAHAP